MTLRIHLFILFLFGLQLQSLACSCTDSITVAESLANADIVLKGKVVKIEIISTKDLPNFNEEDVSPAIKLKHVFILPETMYSNNEMMDTLHILTGSQSASCGFNFKVDTTYIIYASQNSYFSQVFEGEIAHIPNYFWTHLCTRTQKFNEVEEKAIVNYIRKHKKDGEHKGESSYFQHYLLGNKED